MKATRNHAFQLAFQDELKKMVQIKKPYQELTDDEIAILISKILCLPQELKGILFFYYAFGHSITEITQLLDIDLVEKKLWYIQDLLRNGMGLYDTQISEKSLKIACKLALAEENSRLFSTQ